MNWEREIWCKLTLELTILKTKEKGEEKESRKVELQHVEGSYRNAASNAEPGRKELKKKQHLRNLPLKTSAILGVAKVPVAKRGGKSRSQEQETNIVHFKKKASSAKGTNDE